MKILFIGDIVGSPGRKIVHDRLADILTQRSIDLCIANGENSASGFGITPRLAEEIFAAGAEVITGGNHIWDRKEILDFFPHEPRLIRPANFPSGSPGKGHFVGQTKNGIAYAVMNLQGRTFMAPLEDPFRTAERELAALPPDVKVIVVDMHAEATSEKQAMGWHLDGKVSAVLGTHTHVATADNRVLPGRHRLYHRRRHDRPARFRHRHGEKTDRAALPRCAPRKIRRSRRRRADEHRTD